MLKFVHSHKQKRREMNLEQAIKMAEKDLNSRQQIWVKHRKAMNDVDNALAEKVKGGEELDIYERAYIAIEGNGKDYSKGGFVLNLPPWME